MSAVPMMTDLKAAVTWGVLWGVKLGVCGLIVLACLGWALNDYATVRQQARNGAAAAAYIENSIAQQKAQAAKP